VWGQPAAEVRWSARPPAGIPGTMPLNLGDAFPNFKKDTSQGEIQFYDWAGESWVCFCSHPADFTPVCTTELGALAKLVPEFAKRNTKVIALSCDTAESHRAWLADIQAHSDTDGDFPYPIIDDSDRQLATQLGMLDPDEKDAAGAPMACRAVFLLSPDKKTKLSILYPASTGRDFNEILRALDSLQLTAYKKVATPVNWSKGKECMVLPSVKDAECAGLYPKGHRKDAMPSGKGYMRFTPDPTE